MGSAWGPGLSFLQGSRRNWRPSSGQGRTQEDSMGLWGLGLRSPYQTCSANPAAQISTTHFYMVFTALYPKNSPHFCNPATAPECRTCRCLYIVHSYRGTVQTDRVKASQIYMGCYCERGSSVKWRHYGLSEYYVYMVCSSLGL